MLKTKCIYLPPAAADGLRISIMSRHTLDDGQTPDPRIGPGAYQLHWPRLGPPSTLIGQYLRREIGWPEYQRQFLFYLGKPEQRRLLKELVRLARRSNVTLLCVESADELDADGLLHCHRRLVAETCRRIDPSLDIEIR